MRKLIVGLFTLLCLCFNANSNEIISEIETHWNQIDTMSGEFKQEDSDGKILFGKFYFLKPYYSKFVYFDRSENIITNESLFVVVDNEDYKIESYSIGNNVLKKILSKELSIDQQFDLIDFNSKNDEHILTLKMKDDDVSYLNIIFDASLLDIKKWEIYDEFQNKTVFEFTKIKKNIFISQNLFVVKYK